MKQEAKVWAFGIAWLVYIAVIGPAMISEDDSIVVLAGVVVLAVLARLTYRFVVSNFSKPKEEDKHESN